MAVSSSNLETRYDVVLISVGTKPRRVAWTVASFTDLRNEEAKELLRTAPVLILRNASYATAEGAREALERRGATVEVRAYDMETAGPTPQTSTPTTWGQIALVILMVGILILDPPVDAHVVDLDASFRQEFLDIPVGQAEPQVPADGQGEMTSGGNR